MQFEKQVRRFIDQHMTAAFRMDWIKQRVPGEIWQEWKNRQETDRAARGMLHPLVA
ncbi:MAG: hypothetical protein AB7V46_06610 [Thermomicrobiales bacterium]